MPTHDGPFQIQASPGQLFFAGTLPGSRQALVAQKYDGGIIVLMFDAGGTLLKRLQSQLPSHLLTERWGDRGAYEVDEADLMKYLKREFSFQPATIKVREFHLPDDMLEVYRLPKHMQEFLENPDATWIDHEMRAYLPGAIEQWLAEGSFVVVSGNDYWLDREGNVTSS